MLSGHNLPMLNEENRILETDHNLRKWTETTDEVSQGGYEDMIGGDSVGTLYPQNPS